MNSGGPVSELQITEEEFEQAQNGDVESQIKLLRSAVPSENLPTMWAHLGKINNEFGFRRNPFGGRSYEFHAGMDIDGERGDTVVAPGNGVIIKAGWQGGYGNMIEVDHGNGLTTRYGHLSKIEVGVGDSVTTRTTDRYDRFNRTFNRTASSLRIAFERQINQSAIAFAARTNRNQRLKLQKNQEKAS